MKYFYVNFDTSYDDSNGTTYYQFPIEQKYMFLIPDIIDDNEKLFNVLDKIWKNIVPPSQHHLVLDFFKLWKIDSFSAFPTYHEFADPYINICDESTFAEYCNEFNLDKITIITFQESNK